MSVRARTGLTFVGVSLLAHAIWLAVTLVGGGVDAAATALGVLALYGQGLFLALQLGVAQRLPPRPPSTLSSASLVALALGQPALLVACLLPFVRAIGSNDPARRLAAVMTAVELASILGALLLCLLLRQRTGQWVAGPLIAILLVAAVWPLLFIILGSGRSGLHLPGAFGRGSDLTLHPFVTALWQVPIMACAGSWLARGVPER